MGTGLEPYGNIIYTEERNVGHERMRFCFTGIITILFVMLIVYAGLLHSPFLALLAFLFFGLLLYPGILAVLLGLKGIRQLTVYETGFIPPYCSKVSLSMRSNGFISWKDVAGIYSNKNLRVSKIFPYITVELRDHPFTIPADQIINMSLFLNSVKPYTQVVTEKEYRPGIHSIDYYPPSNEARLDDDAIVLNYGVREVRFSFDTIRKVKLKMSHQLVLEDGQRVGLLGMGREDVERILESRKRYLSGDTEAEPDVRDGILRSSDGDDKGEGGLVGGSLDSEETGSEVTAEDE